MISCCLARAGRQPGRASLPCRQGLIRTSRASRPPGPAEHQISGCSKVSQTSRVTQVQRATAEYRRIPRITPGRATNRRSAAGPGRGRSAVRDPAVSGGHQQIGIMRERRGSRRFSDRSRRGSGSGCMSRSPSRVTCSSERPGVRAGMPSFGSSSADLPCGVSCDGHSACSQRRKGFARYCGSGR